MTRDQQALINRLRKNLRHLGRWARRQNIDCFRLYDKDIPSFGVAIDVYGGDQGRWVVLQAYRPPAAIPATLADERLRFAIEATVEVLQIDRDCLFVKHRQRQRGMAQYEKLADQGEFFTVQESPCRFLINPRDYLDTGLFLDHRLTRARIGALASGKRFLNLFAYTGTATVYAAFGGADQTMSVDLSNTYCAWARRNLVLNGFDLAAHRIVQADCLDWVRGYSRERYHLIFLDPPTFSTSKRMSETFDVLRDQVTLVNDVMRLLTPGGTLLFCTNRRGFCMDATIERTFSVRDISSETIPEDFKRNPMIHRCWEIRWSGQDTNGWIDPAGLGSR